MSGIPQYSVIPRPPVARQVMPTDDGEPAQEMSDELLQMQAAPKRVETFRRERPKIGRNDACWCGSGKKYKKCHGA